MIYQGQLNNNQAFLKFMRNIPLHCRAAKDSPTQKVPDTLSVQNKSPSKKPMPPGHEGN